MRVVSAPLIKWEGDVGVGVGVGLVVVMVVGWGLGVVGGKGEGGWLPPWLASIKNLYYTWNIFYFVQRSKVPTSIPCQTQLYKSCKSAIYITSGIKDHLISWTPYATTWKVEHKEVLCNNVGRKRKRTVQQFMKSAPRTIEASANERKGWGGWQVEQGQGRHKNRRLSILMLDTFYPYVLIIPILGTYKLLLHLRCQEKHRWVPFKKCMWIGAGGKEERGGYRMTEAKTGGAGKYRG